MELWEGCPCDYQENAGPIPVLLQISFSWLKTNGFISDTNGVSQFPKKTSVWGCKPIFFGLWFFTGRLNAEKTSGVFQGPKLRSSWTWQVIQKLWKEKQLPRRNSKSGNGDGSGFPSSSSTTSNDWSSLCLGLYKSAENLGETGQKCWVFHGRTNWG